LIEERLTQIFNEVKKGNFALRKLGFWDIVREAKRNKEIAIKYGDKISEINKYVFEKKWKWKFAPIYGISAMLVISVITILAFPYALNDRFYLSVYLPVASFILSASLHPITQYIVGRVFGIKFLYFYLRGIYIFSRTSKGKFHIEPALKLEYASYLRTNPLKRAIMHISGSIITILIVFLFFWLSLVFNVYLWSQVICGGIAISYLLTEIIYSPKYAAWKHFLEEYNIWKETKSNFRNQRT